MNNGTLSPETVWKAALGDLEMQMTRATFTTWLQGTRALSCADDEFVIGVRNDFAKDWLENRLYDLIARTVSAVMNRPIAVRFVVWSEEVIAPLTTLVRRNGRAAVVPATTPASAPTPSSPCSGWPTATSWSPRRVHRPVPGARNGTGGARRPWSCAPDVTPTAARSRARAAPAVKLPHCAADAGFARRLRPEPV